MAKEKRPEPRGVRSIGTVDLVIVLAVIGIILTAGGWVFIELGRRIDAVDDSIGERMQESDASIVRQIEALELSLNRRIDDLGLSLNTRIGDLSVSVSGRIDDLNVSLNQRITGLHEPVTHVPFPPPEMLPPEKMLEMLKEELLTAEPGDETFEVPAGDYVVIPVQFGLGEAVEVEWKAVGPPEENSVDFYLLDREGYLYRYNRAAEYDSTWVSDDDAVYYLYFSNTFDLFKPKILWIRLIGLD